MKKINISVEGNYARLDGLDASELSKLRTAFTFPIDKCYLKHAPKEKCFIAGGLQLGYVPKGLMYDVALHLKKSGYEISIKDGRMPIKAKVPEIIGKLKLRPYQREAVQMALDKGSGIEKLPTASGKTAVIGALVKCSMEVLVDVLYVIITPRSSLLLQFRDDMINDCGFRYEDIGVWDGGSKSWNEQPILITTRQSITRFDDKGGFDEDMFNEITERMKGRRIMMIVDECHEARGETLRDLLKRIDPQWRFGLTGSLPSCVAEMLDVRSFLGTVIYSKRTKELMDQGYLPPLETEVVCITHPDAKRMDYETEVEWLGASPYRNAVITKIARYESDKGRNVLILVERIEQGYLLKNTIPGSVFLQGKDKAKLRYQIQRECEGRSGQIIIATSGIFAMGVSIKKLHAVILTGISSAKISLLQSIGRGLREHDTKKMLKVYDIADNTMYSEKHLLQRLQVLKDEDFFYRIRKI